MFGTKCLPSVSFVLWKRGAVLWLEMSLHKIGSVKLAFIFVLFVNGGRKRHMQKNQGPGHAISYWFA